MNEWMEHDHAVGYLRRADKIPHRTEGEEVLVEILPTEVRRVLDLGCGDGRLLALVLQARPQAEGIGIDLSPTMLQGARERFAGRANVTIIEHDLDHPLREIGRFDRSLYEEVFQRLEPVGVFCNLEHVASPTPKLHLRFLNAIGCTPASEDPSNRLLDVETQLGWLRSIGFEDVDCYWKWLELAVLAGSKPAS